MTDPQAGPPSAARRFGSLIDVAPVVIGLILIALTAGFFHARFGTLGAVLLGIVTGSFLLAAGWLALRNIGDWSNLQQLYNARKRKGPARDGALIALEGQLLCEGEPLEAPFSGRRCAAYAYRVMYRWRRPVSKRGHDSDSRLVVAGFHMLPMRVQGAGQTLSLRSFPTIEDDFHHARLDGSWHARLLELLRSLPSGSPPRDDIDRLVRWQQLQRSDIESIREDIVGGEPGEIENNHTIEEWIIPTGPVCVIGTFDADKQALRAGRWRPGERLMVYQGTSAQVLPRVWREVKIYARISLFLLLASALFYAVAFGHPSSLSTLLIGPGAFSDAGDGEWVAGSRAVWMLWIWPLILVAGAAICARDLSSAPSGETLPDQQDSDHSKGADQDDGTDSR